ncbi:TetR/AcrR family transcriptional regulator [Aeromicrobium panaciterrae]|uniref:TetR/AcrR family transcriptional regulator n=1 Tax=Aeromicrobium panaciterrae TaxID=363861 RepID=UPI0031DAC651
MASVTTDTDVADDDIRPMRADARRNYDKLIAAAREVFTERGSEGSLDEIAKRAGVGPGTLYRHFPTRDDLLDALMRDWTERVVADAEAAVSADISPRKTLEQWFTAYIGHVTLHRGAAVKLSAAMDDESSPMYRKCQTLISANEHVLDDLAGSGALRSGVEARQVMRLISGVATFADSTGIGEDEVTPMLDIVIDGILK